MHGSDQDASFIYPMDSPLPGGGNAVTDYVATKAGWHYVGVADGAGAYDITVEAYRPPLQGDHADADAVPGLRRRPGQHRRLRRHRATVTLSPFAAFLAKWGITRADEDARDRRGRRRASPRTSSRT